MIARLGYKCDPVFLEMHRYRSPLYRFSKIIREVEGKDRAMPCPYRGSISIEVLEKCY
jgi:hypothetical protein